MKKLTLLLCLLPSAFFAQAPVKRYVLLEHFTNSVCSVCRSRNPTFYNLIDQNAADVHHIAYHPPIPYSSCIFYQHNPSENSERTEYYNVFGTPSVSVNGGATTGVQSLTAAVLQTHLGQTSPINIQVAESTAGNQRTVDIGVGTWGTVPAGTYKLYAAVVEKRVDYTSPIGSSLHRNVFRKMLPNIDGVAYTPAALGNVAEFSYTFTLDPAWVADSIYVVAFVQNTTNKSILNSGTQFDPVLVSAGEAQAPQSVQIQPNPATSEAWASLPGEQVDRVEVFTLGGSLARTAFETQYDQVSIPLEGLAPGLYVVKMTGKDGVYVGKLMKN